jgi:hypothetical protein
MHSALIVQLEQAGGGGYEQVYMPTQGLALRTKALTAAGEYVAEGRELCKDCGHSGYL